MKYSTWLGVFAAIVILIVCYTPWIYVASAKLEIAGMYASGKQNFGRPGLVNMVMTIGAIIMFLLPFLWAKRTNMFFGAFNIAWAVRNYIVLSRCYGGDCPTIKTGLYILLIASAIMLLCTYTSDIEIKKEKIQ